MPSGPDNRRGCTRAASEAHKGGRGRENAVAGYDPRETSPLFMKHAGPRPQGEHRTSQPQQQHTPEEKKKARKRRGTGQAAAGGRGEQQPATSPAAGRKQAHTQRKGAGSPRGRGREIDNARDLGRESSAGAPAKDSSGRETRLGGEKAAAKEEGRAGGRPPPRPPPCRNGAGVAGVSRSRAATPRHRSPNTHAASEPPPPVRAPGSRPCEAAAVGRLFKAALPGGGEAAVPGQR